MSPRCVTPTGDTAAPFLRLEAAGLTYPGRVPVAAVRPTDLRIMAGERVAVVGPSGSGKSTLLQILGLLAEPTEGEYFIDGISIALMSDADRCDLRGAMIGFVFQAFHLMPGRTVAQNVGLPLVYSSRFRSSEERRRRVNAALEQVGLADRAGHLANELSGGECQRAAIARALINEPRLVLADEPTGNLDSASSDRIVELLHAVAERGVTVLVITHDLAVADRFERRVRIVDGVVSEP